MQNTVANICINDARQLETELNKAVETAIAEALSNRQGVVIIRHDHRHFTVAVSSDIPFGTTTELDLCGATKTGPLHLL